MPPHPENEKQTEDNLLKGQETTDILHKKTDGDVVEGESVKKPLSIVDYTPIRQIVFLFTLFFSPKFIVHRITGLIYLIQWAIALPLYFYDFEMFRTSPLVWSLPLTGLLQSITAIYTFTFLPKLQKDPGYYSDKSTMTYPFIVENSFFAGILLFQWLYMDNFFYDVLKKSMVFEVCVVFFPYIFRDMWPKTSFRESLNSKTNKQKKNAFFYFVTVNITRIFYMWAKHYIGYFLNYARFLNRITEEEIYHIYLLEIFSAFATTVSMFLHTLKFKRYIGPRTSYLVYMASYLATFYTFIKIGGIFFVNWELSLLTLGGLLVNFLDRKAQHAYQVFVFVLLFAIRYEYAPVMNLLAALSDMVNSLF